MPSPLAERRIEIARAFAHGEAQAIRLDHTKVRFSLGTSLAELRVPFHVTAEVARIFTASARQLVLMLVSRHRGLLAADDFDRFLIDEEFGRVPEVPPLLSPSSGGPEVRATGELAPRAHPALCGGVLCTWLGPGGGGRSLVAVVIELLRKAFAESAALRGREETATLVALVLSTLLPQTEAAIRAVQVPPPVDRYLRGAAGVGVYLALRLGAERALREARAHRATAIRVEAGLSPAVLLGGRASMFGLSATLYGCDLAHAAAVLDDACWAHANSAAFDQLRAAILVSLDRQPEVARRVEHSVLLTALREAALEAVVSGEQLAAAADLASLTSELRKLFVSPSSLPSLLSDEKARKAFQKDLATAVEDRTDSIRVSLAMLADALKSYKEKEPASCVGLSRQAARDRFASALLAGLSDLWVERVLAPVKKVLEPRTGSESEGGLEVEYAEGRLYRIHTEAGPILRSQVSQPMAHLFVDVKDFTRRTALLGQAAMAEFLRRNFYLPILSSAKAHFGGMSHLSDRGGVTVNNLLGDALSLSGDVAALVALALDIRRHLAKYEHELSNAVSSEAVAAAVRRIEEDFAQRAGALSPGSSAAKLAAERDLALARARGEGLEAGVYISHGPAPLVVNIDDDVFGRSRVAIADRINESARGTARSGGARGRMDAKLALERARRRDGSLAHPWSVFVGGPLSLSVPPPAEEAVRAALRAGDGARAMEFLLGTVRELLEELSRNESAPGDIYNAGAALSEEALLAFQEAQGDRRVFLRLELEPRSLHPEIQRRYFFPPGVPIDLLVAFHPYGTVAEIFRCAGRVQFKGLERPGGIGVWELLGELGVGAMLAEHHGAEWFRARTS
ncbi:MAG: hypothetical protein HYZ28_04095 [Myxococcales bacterium]|nr:hypothetical protein [Myxococcales bacterium]